MEFLKETIDYFIFAVLGFMGFVALWLTIERLLFLRKVEPAQYETPGRL